MDTLVFPLLISSLAALAIAEYHVLPQWFYRTWLGRHKPFSCITCLSFWTGFVLTLLTCDFAFAPVYGLASAGLTVVILQITNR
jgi:RsiW-degrading membrane proteinase PrsW (M82 family)